MSNQMKDVIEKLKSENGNSHFTQKELLWYVIHKIDKSNDRIDEHMNYSNSTFATKKLVFTITTISIMLVVALITVAGSLL